MEELERQWVKEILRLILTAGTEAGTLADAEMKSGVQPRYVEKALRGGDNPPIGRILALIRHLGLDPAEVLATVTGGHVERRHIQRPTTPMPTIVKQARERFATGGHSSIPRAFLTDLDEDRYNRPRQSMQALEGAMAYLDPADVPFALGVYASAARPVLEFDTAQWALFEALEMARNAENLWFVGDLLLRLSSFHNSKGHNARALVAAEAATNTFARIGSLEDTGRGLVNQAIFLGQLERNQESEITFRAAIPLIDPENSRNLFTSWHGLGILSLRRQLPQEALERFDEAKVHAKDDLHKGKLYWALGLAFAGLGDWVSLTTSFEKSVDVLMEISPVNAALAACDQIELLLEHGRASEAWLLSATMVRLVGPLEAKSHVAAAAAKDLALALEAATATTSMVAAIAKKFRFAKLQVAR